MDFDVRAIVTDFRENVLSPMKQRLIGKDDIIELLGIALIAGENLFLLGPPGTGKSALVHELSSRLEGTTFDYLLTRFTEPSELFGPFDLRRLKEGDLVTNTEGMLPEAEFVFLDELLNANSAILNSLLLALNERIFRRGRQTIPLPTLLTVGASNRLPEDDALAALFDRFLLRVVCENVPQEKLGEVLIAGWRRESAPVDSAAISIDQIRKLTGHVSKIDLTPAYPAYLTLVDRLRKSGLPISDRRAVRLQRIVAASALMCDRRHADVTDLWVFRYIWETPAQSELLDAQVKHVVQQYTSEPSSSDDVSRDPLARKHPLADGSAPPSPENIAESIELVLQQIDGASLDKLTMLASQIEWIENETARQHLQQQIVQARQTAVDFLSEQCKP